jgi:hypothetical protein
VRAGRGYWCVVVLPFLGVPVALKDGLVLSLVGWPDRWGFHAPADMVEPCWTSTLSRSCKGPKCLALVLDEGSECLALTEAGMSRPLTGARDVAMATTVVV